jgi:mannitol/fructose-specific phosphotransferase system IIA component (Ntr-type)
MKLADFVAADAIVPNLQSDTKEGVVREMTQQLRDANFLDAAQCENIVKAILKREELGSTGIGNGVAVPHTKHPSVDRLVGTVAVSQQGVDFASLDGEPVHVFFLLISPPDHPADHLRALENISRHLRNESFCRFLKQSKTREEIQELLEEADNNQFAS